ncbi:hypothetical protein Pfo_004320 [Paulownia fortunei]|nr:hypothetical protein Pfo_004320 [Paulownia fortunei]
MELESEEIEWPMLRAHLSYSGEFELARKGFNELLKKDPFLVEAYHGLVTVASQEESSEELRNIERRVEEAMKLCKKETTKTDLRDFKLLLAQIRVLEGRYDDALKVYQELEKEEPRDFRPYLCQGIIYTLLRRNSEAEKNFVKYRRLVPKGPPYASYFDDNMTATKIFAQNVDNERAMQEQETIGEGGVLARLKKCNSIGGFRSARSPLSENSEQMLILWCCQQKDMATSGNQVPPYSNLELDLFG